ncbi:MAG TPA: chemotaxis protein CheB [Gemmatimonadaceae bacterium]|nr:chemotaxis protein CheB [Gemmatimonadaceae bacterium]
MAYAIVVVGTSWGGLSAVRELVRALPRSFALPLVVVQHRHPDSDHLLGTLLQDSTPLPVSEVEDKAPIAPGSIYLAPADYHLLVEDGHFSLSMDEPVQYSRPSIDVAFASVADVFGRRAVGVVLTGANADGARGLRRLVDRGGLGFVQTPATAESPTMPAAAMKAVPEARVMAIAEIGAALGTLPAQPVESAAAMRGARAPDAR